MSGKPVEHGRDVRGMISHAENDYIAVYQLDPAMVPGPVAYHCQQCAEKYMKALLSAAGRVAPRTHDLVELKALLGAEWDEAVASEEELEKLTIFEVVGRYWVEGQDLEVCDAELGMDVMERVRSFARAELGLDAADEKAADDNTTTGATGTETT